MTQYDLAFKLTVFEVYLDLIQKCLMVKYCYIGYPNDKAIIDALDKTIEMKN